MYRIAASVTVKLNHCTETLNLYACFLLFDADGIQARRHRGVDERHPEQRASAERGVQGFRAGVCVVADAGLSRRHRAGPDLGGAAPRGGAARETAGQDHRGLPEGAGEGKGQQGGH